MSDPADSFNVARHLRAAARATPGACAVRVPCGRDASGETLYRSRSFAELDRDTDACAAIITETLGRRGVVWTWDHLLVPLLLALVAVSVTVIRRIRARRNAV